MSYCSNCGSRLEAAAQFCGNCGHAVSVDNSDFHSNDTNVAIFAERLDQDLLSGGDVNGFNPPHASLAACLVNGRVHTVIRSGAGGDEPGLLQRLISRIKTALASVLDQKEADKVVYLISDFSGLPVISVRSSAATVSSPERSALFSFWVGGEDHEDTAIETFLRSVLNGATSYTVAEFQDKCKSILEQAFRNTPVSEILASEGARADFSAVLLRQYGVVCEIDIRDGEAVTSQFLELGARASIPRCAACTSEVGFGDEFCNACGERLSPENTRVDASDQLLSMEGEPLTLRIRVIEEKVQGHTEIDASLAQRLLHSAAKDLVSGLSSDELSQQVVLERIGNELISRTLPSLGPTARSLQVTDIRFSNRDWEIKAEARLASQRTRLKSALQALDLEASSLEYEEAAQNIALRKAKQDSDTRVSNAQLAAEEQGQLDKIDLQSQVDSAQLESRRRSKINRIYLDDRIDELEVQSEFSEAEKNERLRGLSREEQLDEHSSRVEVKKSKIEFARRSRDLEQTADLEKRQLDHDAELEGRKADNARAREREAFNENLRKQQETFDAELDQRQRSGNVQSNEADRDQARSLKKLRAMAELEADMANQEARHKLEDLAQESANEVRRAEAMVNMTSEQMLAFQATELAKQAEDPSAIAAITASIADSQATKTAAEVQREQYERMLTIQEKNTENIATNNATAQDAIQQNTKTAMEAMARVAATAAGEQPPASSGDSADTKRKATENHKCRSCNYSAKSSFKFCPKCGAEQ